MPLADRCKKCLALSIGHLCNELCVNDKKWGEELDNALKRPANNPKNLGFEMVPNGIAQGWICPCVLLKRKYHCPFVLLK
jgi:hypothetical protein